jgi:predicted DCC family thiol-disulfide oxidoreductase YuxK
MRSLRFAPLHGTTAANIIGPLGIKLETIYFFDSKTKKPYQKSDAIAHALRETHGITRIVGTVILWVPKGIRDFCYDFVAKNRYRVVRKNLTCRVPSHDERDIFLP